MTVYCLTDIFWIFHNESVYMLSLTSSNMMEMIKQVFLLPLFQPTLKKDNKLFVKSLETSEGFFKGHPCTTKSCKEIIEKIYSVSFIPRKVVNRQYMKHVTVTCSP